MADTTTTRTLLQVHELEVGNVVRDRKTGMLGLVTSVLLDNSRGDEECCGSGGPDHLYVHWQCGHEQDYSSYEEEGLPDVELVPDATAPLALEYLRARDRARFGKRAMGDPGVQPPTEEVEDGTGLGYRRLLDGWVVDWVPNPDLAEGWDGNYPPNPARAVRIGVALGTRVLCLRTGQLGTIQLTSGNIISVRYDCGHEGSMVSHHRGRGDKRWIGCFSGVALA